MGTPSRDGKRGNRGRSSGTLSVPYRNGPAVICARATPLNGRSKPCLGGITINASAPCHSVSAAKQIRTQSQRVKRRQCTDFYIIARRRRCFGHTAASDSHSLPVRAGQLSRPQASCRLPTIRLRRDGEVSSRAAGSGRCSRSGSARGSPGAPARPPRNRPPARLR